jgi:NADH-quinone oxidoreductase subunit D
MEEILQSIRIIDQCLEKLPGGPWRSDDHRVMLPEKEEVYNSIEGMMAHFKIIFESVKVPAGEIYSYTEAANGELGFYIVSDGSGQPYKVHVRAPCFYLLGALDRMLEGGMIADIVPTFDTLNMVGGEIDR